MSLEKEEFVRRLKSARELRAVKQEPFAAELSKGGDRMGLGPVRQWEDPKLEHRPTDLQLGHISRLLRVPEWWFTEPDPFAYGPDAQGAGNGDGLRQVLERLAGVQHGVDRLRDGLFDGEHEAPANDGEEQQYVMQVLRRIEDLLSRLAAGDGPALPSGDDAAVAQIQQTAQGKEAQAKRAQGGQESPERHGRDTGGAASAG